MVKKTIDKKHTPLNNEQLISLLLFLLTLFGPFPQNETHPLLLSLTAGLT